MLPRFEVGDKVIRSTADDTKVRYSGKVVSIFLPEEIDDVLSDEETTMSYDDVCSAYTERDPTWKENPIYAIERGHGIMSYEEALQIVPTLTQDQYDMIMGYKLVTWLAIDSDLVSNDDED